LPTARDVRFAIEFNIATLAAGADDRYYLAGAKPERRKLGRLDSLQDLASIARLSLVDEWLGIDVGIASSRPAGIWAFPIQSVSQSEGGFELVHQSACVLFHWLLPAGTGAFAVELELACDTSMAEARKLVPAG
jgi:alpha-amylase